MDPAGPWESSFRCSTGGSRTKRASAAGHQVFQILGWAWGLAGTVHRHLQVAHQAWVGLGHGPQTLVSAAAGHMGRPGIQAGHQVLRQVARQATQHHDGQHGHGPQGQPSGHHMGFGPAVDHLIDAITTNAATPAASKRFARVLLEERGTVLDSRHGGQGAQDRFSGGVHFVFPSIRFCFLWQSKTTKPCARIIGFLPMLFNFIFMMAFIHNGDS